MYRLYVDEVGSDSFGCVDNDNHRYLSLTGVAIDIDHARDFLQPTLSKLKADVFKHDADEPVILHRTEILGYNGSFKVLRDSDTREQFDKAIISLMTDCKYKVITALIDKKWMMTQEHWAQNHPYHYLMEILVEKYAQFLERKRAIGDIMPEARGKPHDNKLQEAYENVWENGTSFVDATRIQAVIRAKNLKFRWKRDNLAGLQLVDLIAHPSNMYVRHKMGHSVNLGAFAKIVIDILVRGGKYDRSISGKITGYGIKYLPS